MKTTLLATVAALAASAAAFALPNSSDPLCLTTCTPFTSELTNCGYDLTSGSDPTDGELNCMCKTNGFMSNYQNCYNCLNNAGLISSSEGQSTQAIKQACASVGGSSSGAISLTPGSAGVMAGLFVSVGLGFCGIAV